MAVILRSDAVVPEPYSLDLRGIQTDQFGTVFGGHKATTDPLQSGPLRALTGQDILPNIVTGGAAAAVRSAWPDVVASKGLNHDATNRWVRLPDAFNILTMGDEPSFFVSLWITCASTIPPSQSSIAGCMYQTGQYSQWYVCRMPATGNLRVAVRNVYAEFAAPVDAPALLTLVVKRTGAGAFSAVVYLNGSQVQTLTGAYPFPDPTPGNANAWPGPIVGSSNGTTGFGGDFRGKIHRAQIAKINPATFDAPSWIAAEIAANAARFATA